MAVRRLAAQQPASFFFTPENEAWAKGQIAKYPPGRQASAVLPILWRAQTQNNYWLPKPAIERVAEMLDMPFIRVLEIATFYSMFNLEPVGRHFVQLCGTTPCELRGAAALKEVCRRLIGAEHHVSSDGQFAWAEVECLGACCNAPMVQINDDYYEDLTPEILGKLLADLAAGRPVRVGSQAGRATSEPEPGKATSLNDPSLYDGSVIGAWRKRFEEEEARAATKAEAEREASAPAKPPGAENKAAEAPKKAEEAAPRPTATAARPSDAAATNAPLRGTAAGQHAVDSKAVATMEGLSAPSRAADASPPPAAEAGSRPGGPASASAQHAVDSMATANAESLPAAPREGTHASTEALRTEDARAEPHRSTESAIDAGAEQRASLEGERPPALEAPTDGAGDELRRIIGVGTINHKRLNALGVFHFDQIAAWTAANAAWMSAYLGFPGRVERDDWVAQAHDLAGGKPPRFAVSDAREHAEPTPLGGPPTRATVAQNLAQSADAQELTEAQRAAEATAIAARLSRLPESATPEERADAVGERPPALAAPRGGNPDDLKRIRGIGPVNAGKLQELGVFHFDQIAAWGRPQVNWVGAYLAFPGRIDREAWVEQARALADRSSDRDS